MKKILIGSVMALGIGGAAFAAMGGLSWLDAMGLRGETRLVATRVDAYWKARVAGDLEKMSSYLHPLQETLPAPGMLVTEGYELKDVTVDGETALAKLTVQSRLKHPVLSSQQRTVELDTQWVKYEGKWYLAQSPANIYDTIRAYQGKWTPPTAKAPSTPVETTSVQ